MIGSTEILLIFFVVLLFFGARRIPELARGMGKALGEFNRAKEDLGDSMNVNSPYPPEFASKSLRKKMAEKAKDGEAKKRKDKKSKKDKSKKDKKKDKKKKK